MVRSTDHEAPHRAVATVYIHEVNNNNTMSI